MEAYSTAIGVPGLIHKITHAANMSITPLQLHQAIFAAVCYDSNCVTFPGDCRYRKVVEKRCNLGLPTPAPAAIVFPKTVSQIQAVVKVAAQHGIAIQARSGGHSYGNHCFGGGEKTIVIDLRHFQYVNVGGIEGDYAGIFARVGGGTRLKQVTRDLYSHGRALPHGTCPSVGIGGHATIGGLGPLSRTYGAAVDHIVAMTVVLANGKVVTASAAENEDLFFALRGAAASFGIVVEFTFRTQPAPPLAIQFSCVVTAKRYVDMASTFEEWQSLVTKPDLSRKLFSQVMLTTMGLHITGTYFGSEEDFIKEPIAQRFVYLQERKAPPHLVKKERLSRDRVTTAVRRIFSRSTSTSSKRSPKLKASVEVHKNDYLGLVKTWAGGPVISALLGRPCHFHHKSCIIHTGQSIATSSISKLFEHLDKANKGTLLWFVILDVSGGAVNDSPREATAFPHRNVGFFCQAYAVSCFGGLRKSSIEFVDRLKDIVVEGLPKNSSEGQDEGDSQTSIYPGYIDPDLDCPQKSYWGLNLERLKMIKEKYDPGDVFRNPQSIQPAGLSGTR